MKFVDSWLVIVFYGISTIVGYLTPNPFYENTSISNCLAWVRSLNVNTVKLWKTFLFQAFKFKQADLIKLIQFSISTDFVYTQLNVKTVPHQTNQSSASTLSM